MKMMNGMMKMNGDLDDMGMQMSTKWIWMWWCILKLLDPEELKVKFKKTSWNGSFFAHDMGENENGWFFCKGNMKMTEADYNSNALSDPPWIMRCWNRQLNTTLPKDAVKKIAFWIIRKHESLCLEFGQ
jgi:hypothetical protein